MTRPIQPLSLSEKAFARNFIRDFSSPYAIQQPTGHRTNWRTKYNKVSDPLIKAHLDQQCWLGTKASWYPTYFNLDFDDPTPETLEKLNDRLTRLNIDETQYLKMTSPSYAKSKNFRLYLKLEYADRTPTHRLGFTALKNAFGDICEIYPQKRRKDRLPCGLNQDIISDYGVLSNLSWQEEMHYLLKIDPTPIEQLPQETFLFDLTAIPNDPKDKVTNWNPRKEIAELLSNGLQAPSSRHFSQFHILNYLWRSNFLPTDAARFTKTWIRKHHNGFSKDASAARWQSIYYEIDRQTAWIWARDNTLLPDTPHGLNAAITKSDLEFTAELFKGDAVRQKQLLNLISYVRPRQHHEWVFIPAWVWRKDIASWKTKDRLIAILEDKGILESNNSYRVDHYSKKFKLKLPASSEQPLSIDERNVTDFYQALWRAYGSVRDIADLTGFNRMTLHRQFKQG
jgi:hypothetical protein